MNISVLKSKIHRAKVTEANLNYVGSITIDKKLMDAAGIIEYEKVLVVNVENGNRLETYVIKGDEGTGVICLNGAAARLVSVEDHVIIMSFGDMSLEEVQKHNPSVVFVDENNMVKSISGFEKHGNIV